MKKYITKKLIRYVVFVCIMITIISMMRYAMIPLTNEMALTQMQNSNEMFVLMNTFHKVRWFVYLIIGGIFYRFTSKTARDIYNFVKNEKEKTK